MPASAVLYVGDLALMREFYRVCFGLVVADVAPDYCRLESEAWSLMLVESVEAVPSMSPPAIRRNTAVKLAFEVISIDDIRGADAELGPTFDPSHQPWRYQDTLRCDCIDPEGNVVQLVQVVPQS